MEARVIQAVMERVSTMLSHSETMIMQKCNQVIDQQGRDIAQDFALIDQQLKAALQGGDAHATPSRAPLQTPSAFSNQNPLQLQNPRARGS